MRYVTRQRWPHADYDDEPERPLIQHMTVFEASEAMTPTGLLDQHGNELCRVEEMEPIGFRRPKC